MEEYSIGDEVEFTNDEYLPDVRKGTPGTVVEVNEYNLFEVETRDHMTWVHASDIKLR